ncbi:unnamed protein product, partial [Heterotrigona itama]
DSGGDIIPVTKRVRPLDISSDSEIKKNYGNENTAINEFIKMNFSTGSKIVGPNIPLYCTEPIDFFKLFFIDALLDKNNWVDVTKDKLTMFFGVILKIMPIANLTDYCTKQHVGSISFFRDIFALCY